MRIDPESPAWAIYVLTDSTNGKQYVGLTSLLGIRRLYIHRASAKRRDRMARYLGAAMRAHGLKNFSMERVQEGLTKAQASLAERRWIRDLGTQAPGGYNLDPGGLNSRDGGGSHVGAWRRRKCGDWHRGRKRPAEWREAIRRAGLERGERQRNTLGGCSLSLLIRRYQRKPVPKRVVRVSKSWTQRPLYPYLMRMKYGTDDRAVWAVGNLRESGLRMGRINGGINHEAAVARRALFGMPPAVLSENIGRWVDAGRRAARLGFHFGHEGVWAPQGRGRSSARLPSVRGGE